MDAALLQEAKDKLRITWANEDGQITRLIEAARADLNGRVRKELKYSASGLPKTLLLEHVFYNRSNVLHEFAKDYAAELLTLAMDAALGVYDNEPPAE